MKLFFISLGCDKNLVDSEFMLGYLREKGYELTDEESLADIIVVNTCCFIHDAKEESINTILEMAEYKKTGSLKALIVAGCLAQRYHREIQEDIPEVDAIIGTTGYDAICDAIEEALGRGRWEEGGSLEGERRMAVERLEDVDFLPENKVARVNTTGGYTSYLKIAEGCDKRCTYCIIPSIRGKYRSVPMETLLKEAALLAESGTRELILVAQETTLYGVDLYGEKRLPALLKELCKIPGLDWVRLLYCYPEEITDELIQVMKEEEKICHYLDMPIQHCSNGILKRMGRRTSKEDLIAIIAKLRQEIPDIALRTTLITGFPGETEEDQAELEAFVEEMAFDRLGVFPYSEEEGTPAAKMEGQVPEEVKEERRDAIMELQQQIAFEKAEAMPGEALKAIIEGKLPEENVYVGRTYKDAPNVDGFIFVSADRELMSGSLVPVYVTEARGYDLVGELIEE